MSSRINSVDKDFTLLMADSAIQAYNAFNDPPDVTPPDGWEYVGTWSGVDPYGVFFKDKEPFGVIFRDKAHPDTIILSFRGTDSMLDWWEDLFVSDVKFAPYNHNVTIPDLDVSDGFNAIYTTSDGHTQSMQHQLFEWLVKLNPSTVYVTGHSLGSALSELFILDAAVSLTGKLQPQISCMNFACPRVGHKNFAHYYDSLPAQQNPATRTIRIVNHFDLVPKVPPSEVLGYKHVGVYFLVAFEKKGAWVPHYVVRHSMVNYHDVLEKALAQPDQIYVGDVTGHDGVILRSVKPPADGAASLQDIHVPLIKGLFDD